MREYCKHKYSVRWCQLINKTDNLLLFSKCRNGKIYLIILHNWNGTYLMTFCADSTPISMETVPPFSQKVVTSAKNKQKLLYIWTKHKKRNIKQEHKYVYVLNIVFDVYITWTRTRRRRSPAWRRSTTRVWRCCTFQWLNVAFYIWTSDAVSAFGSNFYLFLHL